MTEAEWDVVYMAHDKANQRITEVLRELTKAMSEEQKQELIQLMEDGFRFWSVEL